MNKTIAAVVVAVVLLLIGRGSIYVVDEREKALILQFGQIVRVQEEPGLGFKIPLIQEVVRYDDRILSLDTDTIEVTPSDDRRLIVDAFARYRISDIVRFREAVGLEGLAGADRRLGSILNSQIREVLGEDQVTSDTILSAERRILMNRIRDRARSQAESLGLQVVDVRLKQTNLPDQNLDATFDRMRAERDREAADEIARGGEAAQRVRALADRTVSETVSEAEREAQITLGEADALANATFAEAYGADPEFFDFYRSMQAYRMALQGNNSTLVLTPDSDFFDYLYSGDAPEGAREAQVTAPVVDPITLPDEAGEGDDAAATDEGADAAPDALTTDEMGAPDAEAPEEEADAGTDDTGGGTISIAPGTTAITPAPSP